MWVSIGSEESPLASSLAVKLCDGYLSVVIDREELTSAKPSASAVKRVLSMASERFILRWQGGQAHELEISNSGVEMSGDFAPPQAIRCTACSVAGQVSIPGWRCLRDNKDRPWAAWRHGKP